jgi:DNA-binding transcriptional LysR family regulator
MNVTIRQLEAFRAVAQSGGFTAAAGRLHLTQSALSLQVRELESSLGAKLFDRTTRRVVLTELGESFLPAAMRMLDELSLALARSRGQVQLEDGRLCVATTPLTAFTLMPEVIARYAARYPGIRISLRDELTAGHVVRVVRDGEADVGVAPVPRGTREVKVEGLLADPLVLVCPASHALAARRSVRWRDLANMPLIALGRDNAAQRVVDETFDKEGIAVKRRDEVAFAATALGLVAANLGVAVLPSQVRRIAAGLPVAIRALTSPRVARELSMITPPGRKLGPAAASFREVLVAAAARRSGSTVTARPGPPASSSGA